MAAFRSNHRRGGRFWLLATTLAIMAAFATFFVAASSANLSGSPFESTDGNKPVNGNCTVVANNPWEDWAHVNSGTVRSRTDLTNSKSDDAFGQGTNEDDPNVTV